MKKTYIHNLATDGSECTMCWHPTESGASSELVASNSNKIVWWQFPQDDGSHRVWHPLKDEGHTPEMIVRSNKKVKREHS